jgi:hypothetical protein
VTCSTWRLPSGARRHVAAREAACLLQMNGKGGFGCGDADAAERDEFEREAEMRIAIHVGNGGRDAKALGVGSSDSSFLAPRASTDERSGPPFRGAGWSADLARAGTPWKQGHHQSLVRVLEHAQRIAARSALSQLLRGVLVRCSRGRRPPSGSNVRGVEPLALTARGRPEPGLAVARVALKVTFAHGSSSGRTRALLC